MKSVVEKDFNNIEMILTAVTLTAMNALIAYFSMTLILFYL